MKSIKKQKINGKWKKAAGIALLCSALAVTSVPIIGQVKAS